MEILTLALRLAAAHAWSGDHAHPADWAHGLPPTTPTWPGISTRARSLCQARWRTETHIEEDPVDTELILRSVRDYDREIDHHINQVSA